MTTGKEKLFAYTDHDCTNNKVIFNRLWECSFVEQKWRLVKPRPDKLIPNNEETIINTLKNLDDNITIQDLSDEICTA